MTDWFNHWSNAPSSLTNGANLRPHFYDVEKVVDYLVKKMKISPYDVVLDAGCGNGLTLKAMDDKVALMYGIDYSKKMIELATEQLKGQRVTLFVADVRKIPLEDASVSKVFSLGVLQYLPTLQAAQEAVKEMYRVCKKNGLILIGDTPNRKKFVGQDGMNAFLPKELARDYKYEVSEAFFEPERRFDLLIKK